MKKLLFSMLVLAALAVTKADAQYVRVRPGFSVTVGTPPGPGPRGQVWIGPEWAWRGGRYVEVPGYWARPRRHGAMWIPGQWQHYRRGDRWVPGHWR